MTMYVILYLETMTFWLATIYHILNWISPMRLIMHDKRKMDALSITKKVRKPYPVQRIIPIYSIYANCPPPPPPPPRQEPGSM